MITELQRIGAQLMTAAINGVYQGIIVVVLAALVLRMWTRTNAATRHAVWFSSLVLLVLIIPAHYCLDRFTVELKAGSQGDAPNSAGVPSRAGIFNDPKEQNVFPFDFNLISLGEGSNPEPVPGPLAVGEGSGSTPDLEARAWKQANLQPEPAHLDGVRSAGATPARWPSTLTQALRWAGARFLQPASWKFGSVLGLPLLWTLLSVWLAVAGIRLMLLGWRLVQLGRLTDGSAPAGQELQTLFKHLRAKGKVCRPVELRVSSWQQSPIVLGFIHPVILLPADLETQRGLVEAEHVLGHELAHVRRYDDWANLVQHFVQSVLFFHPAVWWISRQLSLEREIACDDHVLEQGGKRRDYALILTSVASRFNQRPPMLAPGALNSNSQLQQRISMILNTRRNSSPCLAKARLASIVSATALIAVLALYSGPRFLLAQTPAQPSAAVIVAGSSSATVGSAAISPAEASSPTAASVASFAEADAPRASAPSVEPGPKFKPENPSEDPPEAPEPPGLDNVPGPMAAPHVARVGRAPRASRTPDGANYAEGSIEERLQRLEKMVQSLMAHQNKRSSDFIFKDGDQDSRIFQQQAERQKELADRQAARAAEAANRAKEQYKRAKELENSARMEADQRGQGEFKEAFQRQLEALRKTRESLGQEMERLDRQIEKLEKQQQRSEQNQQRRSDAPRKGLQAQLLTPEPAIAAVPAIPAEPVIAPVPAIAGEPTPAPEPPR